MFTTLGGPPTEKCSTAQSSAVNQRSFRSTRSSKDGLKVQLMVEGEKTRFWIPSELAYGNRPGRPQGTLVFDVELLKIIK